MNRKNFFRAVILIFIFIILQTYFQYNIAFKVIISKWMGYFIPLIWAVFISIILSPAIDFLEYKLKVRRAIAIVIILLGILIMITGLLFMLLPEIASTIKELNELYPYIVERTTDISRKIIQYLSEKNILIFNQNKIIENISNLIKTNFNDIQKFMISILQNIVWWTIGVMNFLIGLFLAILILLDKKLQKVTGDNIIIIIFGKKNKEYIIKKIKDSNIIFINYIVGKMIVSFFVGVSVFLILKLTRTPYASISAILLGVGNMIPYIGTIIGGLVAIFLIFIVAPIKIIYLLIAIVISQILDGFVIGPKIIGDKVGLNTFWVIISVVLFGGLFGIVGMFLGVPLMCIIKLFYTDLLEWRKK